jgi:hypothetical protein
LAKLSHSPTKENSSNENLCCAIKREKQSKPKKKKSNCSVKLSGAGFKKIRLSIKKNPNLISKKFHLKKNLKKKFVSSLLFCGRATPQLVGPAF